MHEQQTNLALLQTTQLSTTLGVHESSRAVDGNDIPSLLLGSCASSGESDANPWLMIQLVAEEFISTIIITNADRNGNNLILWTEICITYDIKYILKH